MTRYYGDVSVGDSYETSGYTLTKEQIVAFAKQFDPQPFHVDEEAARASIFGEIIASGLHTLCLSVRLYTTDFFQSTEEIAIMGGWGMDELRFHEPVYPGDTLRVQIEIVNKTMSESQPDRGYVDFLVKALVEDREVLTVIAHGIVERDGKTP
jgi:acyl dehydratase